MRIDALARSTVAHIRVEPDQRSELFSQAVLGEGVTILQEKERWVLCRTGCGSEGWIHRGFLAFDEDIIRAYRGSDAVSVRALHARCLAEPEPEAVTLTVLTDGSGVLAKRRVGKWVEVLLPDGRSGWIPERVAVHAENMPDAQPANVVARALEYLGIPYLWGGTSTLALDCSGFTQLVFRLHGKLLPRNSADQARVGKGIDAGSEWSALKGGDLLFFAERQNIDHVALSLGADDVIHASMSNGCVTRESLNPGSPEHNPRLAGMFRCARRVV